MAYVPPTSKTKQNTLPNHFSRWFLTWFGWCDSSDLYVRWSLYSSSYTKEKNDLVLDLTHVFYSKCFYTL